MTPDTLLGTEGIAKMLSLTQAYVARSIVRRPDFPAPAVARSPRLRRWRQADVMKWASADMKTILTCTIDNPDTWARECWQNGRLIFSYSATLFFLKGSRPPPPEKFFFGANIGDWKAGQIVGDPAAMLPVTPDAWQSSTPNPDSSDRSASSDPGAR